MTKDGAREFDLESDEGDDWTFMDVFEEEIDDLSRTLAKARDEENLGQVALVGLNALALEYYHDKSDCAFYASQCMHLWIDALAIHDGIISARQQG